MTLQVRDISIIKKTNISILERKIVNSLPSPKTYNFPGTIGNSKLFVEMIIDAHRKQTDGFWTYFALIYDLKETIQSGDLEQYKSPIYNYIFNMLEINLLNKLYLRLDKIDASTLKKITSIIGEDKLLGSDRVDSLLELQMFHLHEKMLLNENLNQNSKLLIENKVKFYANRNKKYIQFKKNDYLINNRKNMYDNVISTNNHMEKFNYFNKLLLNKIFNNQMLNILLDTKNLNMYGFVEKNHLDNKLISEARELFSKSYTSTPKMKDLFIQKKYLKDNQISKYLSYTDKNANIYYNQYKNHILDNKKSKDIKYSEDLVNEIYTNSFFEQNYNIKQNLFSKILLIKQTNQILQKRISDQVHFHKSLYKNVEILSKNIAYINNMMNKKNKGYTFVNVNYLENNDSYETSITKNNGDLKNKVLNYYKKNRYILHNDLENDFILKINEFKSIEKYLKNYLSETIQKISIENIKEKFYNYYKSLFNDISLNKTLNIDNKILNNILDNVFNNKNKYETINNVLNNRTLNNSLDILKMNKLEYSKNETNKVYSNSFFHQNMYKVKHDFLAEILESKQINQILQKRIPDQVYFHKSLYKNVEILSKNIAYINNMMNRKNKGYTFANVNYLENNDSYETRIIKNNDYLKKEVLSYYKKNGYILHNDLEKDFILKINEFNNIEKYLKNYLSETIQKISIENIKAKFYNYDKSLFNDIALNKTLNIDNKILNLNNERFNKDNNVLNKDNKAFNIKSNIDKKILNKDNKALNKDNRILNSNNKILNNILDNVFNNKNKYETINNVLNNRTFNNSLDILKINKLEYSKNETNKVYSNSFFHQNMYKVKHDFLAEILESKQINQILQKRIPDQIHFHKSLYKNVEILSKNIAYINNMMNRKNKGYIFGNVNYLEDNDFYETRIIKNNDELKKEVLKYYKKNHYILHNDLENDFILKINEFNNIEKYLKNYLSETIQKISIENIKAKFYNYDKSLFNDIALNKTLNIDSKTLNLNNERFNKDNKVLNKDNKAFNIKSNTDKKILNKDNERFNIDNKVFNINNKRFNVDDKAVNIDNKILNSNNKTLNNILDTVFNNKNETINNVLNTKTLNNSLDILKMNKLEYSKNETNKVYSNSFFHQNMYKVKHDFWAEILESKQINQILQKRIPDQIHFHKSLYKNVEILNKNIAYINNMMNRKNKGYTFVNVNYLEDRDSYETRIIENNDDLKKEVLNYYKKNRYIFHNDLENDFNLKINELNNIEKYFKNYLLETIQKISIENIKTKFYNYHKSSFNNVLNNKALDIQQKNIYIIKQRNYFVDRLIVKDENLSHEIIKRYSNVIRLNDLFVKKEYLKENKTSNDFMYEDVNKYVYYYEHKLNDRNYNTLNLKNKNHVDDSNNVSYEKKHKIKLHVFEKNIGEKYGEKISSKLVSVKSNLYKTVDGNVNIFNKYIAYRNNIMNIENKGYTFENVSYGNKIYLLKHTKFKNVNNQNVKHMNHYGENRNEIDYYTDFSKQLIIKNSLLERNRFLNEFDNMATYHRNKTFNNFKLNRFILKTESFKDGILKSREKLKTYFLKINYKNDISRLLKIIDFEEDMISRANTADLNLINFNEKTYTLKHIISNHKIYERSKNTAFYNKLSDESKNIKTHSLINTDQLESKNEYKGFSNQAHNYRGLNLTYGKKEKQEKKENNIVTYTNEIPKKHEDTKINTNIITKDVLETRSKEDVTKPILNELLTSSNMNLLVDQVYKQLERKLKFERKRYGL